MDEMIVETGRRVVATLPVGTPLIAAIDAICNRHEITQGEVRLRGALREVRLSLGDDTEPLHLSGTVQVVSGEGELAPDLGVTGFSAVLSWVDRGMPRVVAGVVEQAESAGVRVIIEAWESVERLAATPKRPSPRLQEPRTVAQPESSRPEDRPPPERRELRPNGAAPIVRSPAEAARTASSPPARPGPAQGQPVMPPEPLPADAGAGGGWAAAVAASRSPPPPTGRPGGPLPLDSGAGPLDEDPEAKPGDILVHPQFGRCKVLGGTDSDRIKIRMATGRFVDLHLGYVKLIRQADEDGVRVFRVQPIKR